MFDDNDFYEGSLVLSLSPMENDFTAGPLGQLPLQRSLGT